LLFFCRAEKPRLFSSPMMITFLWVFSSRCPFALRSSVFLGCRSRNCKSLMHYTVYLSMVNGNGMQVIVTQVGKLGTLLHARCTMLISLFALVHSLFFHDSMRTFRSEKYVHIYQCELEICLYFVPLLIMLPMIIYKPWYLRIWFLYFFCFEWLCHQAIINLGLKICNKRFRLMSGDQHFWDPDGSF